MSYGNEYAYPCPKCGVKEGQWCRERDESTGRYWVTIPHRERLYPTKREARDDK